MSEADKLHVPAGSLAEALKSHWSIPSDGYTSPMRRALLLAALFGFAVTPPLEPRATAAPQASDTGPGRFLTVKSWQLTWTMQVTQTSTFRNGRSSANGTSTLTLDDTDEGAGIVDSEGTWTGNGQVDASSVFHEEELNSGKHREGGGSTTSTAVLNIAVDRGTYEFSVACDEPVMGQASQWSPARPRRNFTDTIPVVCPGVTPQRLPTSGLTLSGTSTHRNDGDGEVATINWTISPVGAEDYELLIEPVGDYDTWLPEGHLRDDLPDEATGANRISFRVRFQKVGGGVPRQRPAAFEFDLLDGSNEKGVCLNYPSAATADRKFDLRFHEGDGRFSEVSDDGVHAVQESPESLDFRVEVHSFDFAAYGQLRIKAKMAGGREVMGRFVPTGRERIPIPRDDDGDRISDLWESRNGAGGAAPDEDADRSPSGQARAGDGITLFEEYRGFVRLKGRGAERVHHRTDPNVKSLFVIDEERLFSPEDWATATAMESFRLSADLVGTGTTGKPAVRNATNFNRGFANGPEFDYAVRLQTQGGRAGDATQLGNTEMPEDIADNPGDVEFVMVSPSRIRAWVQNALPRILEQLNDRFRAGTGGPIRDEFTARLMFDAQRELLTNPAIVTRVADQLTATTVVHELGHACGMFHHGVDPVTLSVADDRSFRQGERTCPTRYHDNQDFLTIAVMETLFPRENGMLLDSGKFCSQRGCWPKLNVREWR